MQQKYLVVVDMQNDFTTGALGTPEARAIVPGVVEYASSFPGVVLLTRDTHYADYLTTREGRLLPVTHCVEGSDGWQFVPGIQALRTERGWRVFDKETFASTELAHFLAGKEREEGIASVEIVGLCTDVCVISSALVLRSACPQTPVYVHPTLCAGSTPERHERALDIMAACQVLPAPNAGAEGAF